MQQQVRDAEHIGKLLLLLSVVALAVSLFNGVQICRSSDEALIQALMAQNAALQAQIDALTSQSGEDAAAVPTLTAVAWSDGLGADVTLTVETDAESVLLRVMAGSDCVAEVPCRRDGDLLVATAQVAAGNSYTYSMIIGDRATTLASPENPVYPELVFLADALNAYCNLVVSDWHVADDTLTLKSFQVQIQPPLLGSDGLYCAQVDLILKSGDTVLTQVDITELLNANGTGYDAQITDIAFSLPALAEGEEVGLWMEARLSDGQVLQCCAATWYAMHGGFSMAVG